MNGFFYDEPLDILKFFILGVAWGLYYDIFRIFRIARRTGCPAKINTFYLRITPKRFFEKKSPAALSSVADTLIVFIEDILFMLGCALGFILLAYATNEGEIRIFGFILCILGFSVYYISIGKAVMLLSENIIFSIKILIYWLLYIIIKPIRLFSRAIRWLFEKTIGALISRLSYKRRLAYTKRLCFELLKNAENGFIDDAEVNIR